MKSLRELTAKQRGFATGIYAASVLLDLRGRPDDAKAVRAMGRMMCRMKMDESAREAGIK